MKRETSWDHSADRIELEITRKIVVGAYPADQFLPGTDRLVDHFKVAYATIRSAIGRLISRGLLVFEHGVGTRVVDLQSSMDLALMPDIIRAADREPARRLTLIAQVFGFLRFIYMEMADRAGMHRTKVQLDWLRHYTRLLEDRLELGCDRATTGDCELQLARVFAAASGCVTHTAVMNSMREVFLTDVLGAPSPLIPVAEQWALIEALEARDSVGARRIVDAALWRHEEHAIDELKKLGWVEQPGGAVDEDRGERAPPVAVPKGPEDET